MKKSILILLVLTTSIAFSRSKKEILTQKWKLDKVEDFGQVYDPMDNQKNDWLEFTSNGKFTGIIEGFHVEGTFSVGKSVSVKVDKTKSKLKIN